MSQSYCALYVDAGYLLAAAATRTTGTSLRAGIEVAPAQLIDGLVRQVCEDSGMPLLRTQWYDAVRFNSMTEQQKRTASIDDVARMQAAKPSVPSDLDRALLLDLSARLDNFYLDDTTRFKLRARFWEILDEVS